MTEPRDFADALSDAVTRAIEDTLAAHGGGMVRAYALALDYFDDEGEPAWATAHAERQGAITTLGLLRFHTMSIEGELGDYFRRP